MEHRSLTSRLGISKRGANDRSRSLSQCRHYPKAAIPGYGLATYIALSRMAANKHYLSDIVAGGGLGWGIGRVVVRRNDRPPDVKPGKTGEPPPDKTTWQIAPWRGPAGDGRGLALVVTF